MKYEEISMAAHDKVAIFSKNRYEWWVSDLAIISGGGVNAAIYPTSSMAQARYILENSDAKFCFVGTKDYMQKVLNVQPLLPNLKEIVVFDEMGESAGSVISFKDV
ncbi:MAG: AMP-binding protein [Proteobacteria bacterium]|nr:AMP-binding protein [Pseudomonadota bacterium]